MNPFNSLQPMGNNLETSALASTIGIVNGVVSAALGILTAGVVILAIFIAFKFFTADDDSKRKNAKAQLIYAIIGIIVLIALLIIVPQVITQISGVLKDTGN